MKLQLNDFTLVGGSNSSHTRPSPGAFRWILRIRTCVAGYPRHRRGSNLGCLACLLQISEGASTCHLCHWCVDGLNLSFSNINRALKGESNNIDAYLQGPGKEDGRGCR